MGNRYSVLIQDSGEEFACDGSKDLLRSMEVLGRRGIPVGCRGGGCGVCKVHVTAGSYEAGKMSRSCVSEAEEKAGVVLACKVLPRSDLELKVVGKLHKALCMPRR